MSVKRELNYHNGPLIMGILNVTPDSFYDGGHHSGPDKALDHALKMVDEGASIIDVGGESTRPFADEVDVNEELRRVIPVIEKIRAYSDVTISIDTYKAEVAETACAAGADMINDISGLTFDEAMAPLAARLGVYTVIMHIKGTPKDMQASPFYKNVITEIGGYFIRQMNVARDAGIEEDHIILDPGIGFGKRLEDNLKIIKDLRDFKTLGKPLLVGLSMKTFIGRILDQPNVEDRLTGTLAGTAASIMNGADIVRVHDVAETAKVVKIIHAIMES